MTCNCFTFEYHRHIYIFYLWGMKNKLLLLSCSVLASTLILAWCTPTQTTNKQDATSPSVAASEKETSDGKALQIVTTFPPLYAHAANIIDENDTLTNLVPPGTSVHTRQPRPSDVIAMEQADAIIINGLWLEEFLGDYLDTLEEKWVRIIDTSTWIEYIEYEEHHDKEHHDEEHHDEEHHHEEHHHDHEWPDPHIWLDITNAQWQTRNIREALIELDSTQKEVYTSNADAYIAQLSDVDAELKATINPENTAPFIVFHDAYQYFLQSYSIADKQVGLVQDFHGDNPSQKQIAELIEQITEYTVSVIYTEPQFNPSIVQRLQEETGVQTKEIDPIGSDLSKDGYTSMMKNLWWAFATE